MSEAQNQPPSEEGEFLKIRLNSIHPSEAVPFDIFVIINERKVHYLRAGDNISAQKIQNFEKRAPDAFCIRNSDKQAYKNYVHGRLGSSKVTPKEKAVILRESSLSLIEELFENPDLGAALNESRGLVDEFIGFMDAEPEAMAHLIGLSSHDFYTYNHSLDVGIYSLGLAQAVGFSAAELKEMGEGALFHDIGKRNVHIDIICKTGPLDDTEWAQMRLHPNFGLKLLSEQKVSPAVLACVFEHHESALGNGYPQGLSGNEIHPMARVVAIADTYDALTTKRSYNTPMTPSDALSFMKEKLGPRYDQDLLHTLCSVLFQMKIASK